jgi:hypothetical protein
LSVALNKLTSELIQPFLFEEDSKVKKVVGIYTGRFQPMGKHHADVYHSYKSKFDDFYVTTSNKVEASKSPLNFREKKKIIQKHGIPSSKIVQVRNTYKSEEVVDKFDEETTAIVFLVGSKDAGRLSGGKYFLDYKKNKNYMTPYGEHGYFWEIPHVSITVAGQELSGTAIRNIFGSKDFDDKQKKKFMKEIFGWVDNNIFKMLVKKLSEQDVPMYDPSEDEDLKIIQGDLSESEIIHFIKDVDISKIIREAQTTGTNIGGNSQGVDDGPRYFYGNFKSYKKMTAKIAARLGMQVVNYIVGDGNERPMVDTEYPNGPVPSVSFFPSGDIGVVGGTNLEDLQGTEAFNKWKKHITPIATSIGYELVRFLGSRLSIDQTKDYPQSHEEAGIWKTKAGKAASKAEKKKDLVTQNFEESISIMDEVKLILQEGGAYGHMAHPYDDMDLTFGDLKQIIDMGLQGKLSKSITEKLDGQAISVSWKNGKLIAARNKGHLKNQGAAALDVSGLKAMFAGRGHLTDAFGYAVEDLEKAIKSLGKKAHEDIFGEGSKFMAIEIIWPATSNVIPYNSKLLVFHGITEYDNNGKAIGGVPGAASTLSKLIDKANASVQKHYKIGAPTFLTVKKSNDYGKKKSKFMGILNSLMGVYSLGDADTLAIWHQMYWQELIMAGANSTDYPGITNNILWDLCTRWAFGDKSYKINDIKKDLKDYPQFLSWVLTKDKVDVVKLQKQNMKPFENLIAAVGAEILMNASGFLAANPDSAIQSIRKEVAKAAKAIAKTNDPKKISLLNVQMAKINAAGGFEKIVPSEGLVFMYKNKVYKLTGLFAPINQITGLLKFGR